MNRAFIADDEPALRKILRKVAEMHGWAVTECADGDQLLQSLDSDDGRGLIFLDLQMPKMDGIEALTELASLQSDCTIYLMTGGSTANARAAQLIGNARGLTINDVLTKPIPLKTLGGIFEQHARV